MTTKYIYEELVIIVKYQLLVHIHPLNTKCMYLGLPSQGANNVVHVRAIGGGTSERSCGHELLCRLPVSIPSHIQGDVNVIHKLDYGAPFVPKYSTCATFINDERHL